jgi:hypothetical protein
MAKSGPFYVRKEHRQPKDGEEASTSKVWAFLCSSMCWWWNDDEIVLLRSTW